MIESFVDLTYRGLPLGRRVKLARVRPTSGYLELPTPMPVGTTIAIVTDEGVVIEAVVRAIHEQVGGSDKTPGMHIIPALAGPDIASWWAARVALPDEEPRPTPPRPEPTVMAPVAAVAPSVPMRDEDIMAAAAAMAAMPSEQDARPVTVRPRTHTMVDAIDESSAPVIRISEEHSVPELVDDGKKTTVMDSIDPALLEQLLRSSSDSLPVVDDKPTQIMTALDPAALGLEVSKSGEMAAVDPDPEPENDGAGNDGGDDPSKPTGSGPVRRRRAPKKR